METGRTFRTVLVSERWTKCVVQMKSNNFHIGLCKKSTANADFVKEYCTQKIWLKNVVYYMKPK